MRDAPYQMMITKAIQEGIMPNASQVRYANALLQRIHSSWRDIGFPPIEGLTNTILVFLPTLALTLHVRPKAELGERATEVIALLGHTSEPTPQGYYQLYSRPHLAMGHNVSIPESFRTDFSDFVRALEHLASSFDTALQNL